MNDHFISIQVDREERPDVDAIYTFRAGKHGAWWVAMSVWLTPELKPVVEDLFSPESRKDRFCRGLPSSFSGMEGRILQLMQSMCIRSICARHPMSHRRRGLP